MVLEISLTIRAKVLKNIHKSLQELASKQLLDIISYYASPFSFPTGFFVLHHLHQVFSHPGDFAVPTLLPGPLFADFFHCIHILQMTPSQSCSPGHSLKNHNSQIPLLKLSLTLLKFLHFSISYNEHLHFTHCIMHICNVNLLFLLLCT